MRGLPFPGESSPLTFAVAVLGGFQVEHVTEETDFLRLSLERFAGREERRNQEAAARDELMRRSVSGAMGGEIEP